MDSASDTYFGKYRKIMLGFAVHRLLPDDVDDVVSDALATFAKFASPKRTERELVSYALYCVRSSIADLYRYRRCRPVMVSGVEGFLGGRVDEVVPGSVDVEFSATLATVLPDRQLRLAELLMEGHTMLSASKILGISYYSVHVLRDQMRVALQPLVPL